MLDDKTSFETIVEDYENIEFLDDNDYLANMDYLRSLSDVSNVIQRQRIGMDNRLRAIRQGADTTSEAVYKKLLKLADRFRADERRMKSEIVEVAKEFPIIHEVAKVKGLSFDLVAQLVCRIDITKAKYPSSLVKYCGMGVNMEGSADRPTKGIKLPYNKICKVICYKIAVSFIKCGSPYATIYRTAKETYLAKYGLYSKAGNPGGWTKLHIHYAAIRKMMKIFLCHLYEVWKRFEELPIYSPYVFDKLGHEHQNYISPFEMGWDESNLPAPVLPAEDYNGFDDDEVMLEDDVVMDFDV